MMHSWQYWMRALVLLAGLSALPACEPGRTVSAPGCQLYISTDPAGASIICDDRAAPNPSPMTVMGLTAGEHLIIARKPGYAEARMTATVQPGERLTVNLKLEPLRGLVLIYSKPLGADVEIDDAHYGKTPLLVPDFPLGQHRVKLSAIDHIPKTVEVTVTDRTPQQVNVNLQSDSAWLIFESKPAGAQVTINNTVIGNTPCEASRLSAGRHRVEITLKGHTAYQDELTTQSGEERTVSVTLKALPGKLTVISIPPKARLYLNDQYKTETPFTTNAIPAKTYVLRVELPGYATQVRTNVVTAGEESVVEFRLAKTSGTLLLSTEPPGVTVYLDGENRGITPPHGQEPISEQLTIERVPQGPRKLQMTKQGYYDLTANVEVAFNQTVILHEKLMARPVTFIPTVIVRTGSGAEHTFQGIVREKYDNGDIKFEIEPGIFKTFKASEIQSLEPIPQNPPSK
ncbi:MAG: PEGA domain-containing protein [Verrucomicrobia bacterium]|nr:PEGA domain-containing protein [Verrucomicrobiota bacterium]